MGVNSSDNIGYIGCLNLRVSAVAAVETATIKFRDAVMEIELMSSTLAVANLEAQLLKQPGHFCTSKTPLSIQESLLHIKERHCITCMTPYIVSLS